MIGATPWRYTAAAPQLVVIDARALIALWIWLIHMSYETAAAAAVGVTFFVYLAWRGYSPLIALLALRTALVGRMAPVASAAAQRDRMLATSPHAVPRCLFRD